MALFSPADGMYLKHEARSHERVRTTTRVHVYHCAAFSVKIPPGFPCDGASIPWFFVSLMRLIDPGDIHERATYFHDFNYRYQPASKAVCDAEMYQMLREDFKAAGCGWFRAKLLPWIMWKSVEYGGHRAWNNGQMHVPVFRKDSKDKVVKALGLEGREYLA